MQLVFSSYILWAQRALCLLMLLVMLGVDLLPFWPTLSIFPAVPLIGIFYLFIFRPDVMTLEILVLLGIIQDGIYGYPLGLSILSNLLLYGLLFTQRRFIDKQSFLFLWGAFAGFALIAYALHWGLVSFARGEVLSYTSRLTGLALTITLFPPMSVVLSYFVKKRGGK